MSKLWQFIKRFLIGLMNLLFGGSTSYRKERSPYRYWRKNYMLSQTEMRFFNLLVSLITDKYYVFPQVHLSTIFEHKVRGQSWRGAFSHINGKSVDYVICEKTNLRPVLGIELDDRSHSSSDRRQRDIEVERIFEQSQLPLVRFTQQESQNISVVEEKLSSYLNLESSNNLPKR